MNTQYISVYKKTNMEHMLYQNSTIQLVVCDTSGTLTGSLLHQSRLETPQRQSQSRSVETRAKHFLEQYEHSPPAHSYIMTQ